ncbi:Cys/Met metabolism PLP-dependent enzyme-domain-containing protein [Mycena epipterygia]|nr:Cys/Met metabolism PLP-dependent enzyme-domain-containing protein [Mycena epipterygia]
MAAPNPYYREPDFETLQLHAGQAADPATKARAVPIYQSTSFLFNNVEHAQKLFSLQQTENMYSRVANPTVDVFEKRMAALEGGMAAVATSSGQAASALTITSLASVGDNRCFVRTILILISTPPKCPTLTFFSQTYNQFKITFKRYDIDTKFVTSTNPADYAAVINEKTKAIYVESISNSDTVLADIAGLAKVAHYHGIPLIVDNTLGMGGYMTKLISLGADIVGKFDWRKSDKFPMIAGPSESYGGACLAEICFPVGFAVQVRIENLRDLGPVLSATSAFMVLQGVETLSLRAQRHCENARAVAKFLEAHPRVIAVTYLGLPSHQSNQLALKTMRPNSFSGMLTFRVEGGFEKLRKVIDNLKLASHLANLGDAKTLVIAPFITVQAQLTPEERESTGITDDLIRETNTRSYSVGIESAADIIADLEGALKVAYDE